MKKTFGCLWIVLHVISGIHCTAQDPNDQQSQLELEFTLYLIGDAGKDFQNESNPVLELIRPQLDKEGENSAVVFLGDNIYPKGLPPKGHQGREIAENIIKGQLNALENFQGRTIVIPGNHDWKKGKRGGWEHVNNQEIFVEAIMDSTNVFLPDNGCPGPVEVPLGKDLTLVVVDTQWLLHPWEKPIADEDCTVNSVSDILVQFDDILRRNVHKKIIVAAHHPLYSYGIHGGVTSLEEHIFPLKSLNKSLYIPLPGIGSLYPLYRKLIGNIQDIRHPKYKAMKDVFTQLFSRHPNIIYTAGHEHSMQYIPKGGAHYIVSGSGSKSTHVKRKSSAGYADNRLGFAKLIFDKNGDVRLEIWQINEGEQGEKTFEKLLFNQPYSKPVIPNFDKIDYSDSVVLTSASEQYDTKKPGLFGENYRQTWKTKIRVPVFDIGTEKGGLRIIQRGGGQQTRSLRLEAKDGKQYVLRSVEKYTEKAVPEALRGTVAADIVQDQISASHPYAALIVSYLAEAAGIYHTNPKVVYVPKDPRLGRYRDYFGNSLFIFEERPHGDQSDAANFGNSKKIYSTPKVLNELYKDNDNYVDQLWTIKSRLFDMLVADWDRHDDQWRWASFDVEKGKMFRPIPRDRDQAFFVNQGLFMRLAKKKWAMPKFQGFDYDYQYVPGFNYNARYFDRDFLNEASLTDWLSVADTLQKKLTDDAIEKAVKNWPDPVYQLKGEEVISKLKSQRNNLKDYAKKHYLFLAKAVSVRGSNKNEFFEVIRLNDEETSVRVYKKTKKENKAKLFYDRKFYTSETKEIRLYGIDGNDHFVVEGEVKRGPVIRIISGLGEDQITDRSKVKGLVKKNKIYDDLNGNNFKLGSESKDFTANTPDIHQYNRKAFKYDKLTPLIYASINRDDGIFLGGGFIFTKYGFRKYPYKSNHFLLASLALATNSFRINYTGTFTESVGKWDLTVKLDLFSPNYTTNFFGIGNESNFDENADETTDLDKAIDFYRISYNHFNNEIILRKRIGEFGAFSVGHHLQMFKVEDDYDNEDRFFLNPANINNDPDFFNWKSYAGGILNFKVDMRDNLHLPTRGISLETDIRGNKGLNEKSEDYATIQGEFSLFLSFRLPAEITIASRIGGGYTFGDYEFYQGQQLGGLKTLRGFRKTRFYGDSRLFHNLELRSRITTIKNPILPITMGVTLFNDLGRVWVKDEDSDTLHHGYGGGLWFAPLNAAVFAVDVAHSREGLGFYLRLGFMF